MSSNTEDKTSEYHCNMELHSTLYSLGGFVMPESASHHPHALAPGVRMHGVVPPYLTAFLTTGISLTHFSLTRCNGSQLFSAFSVGLMGRLIYPVDTRRSCIMSVARCVCRSLNRIEIGRAVFFFWGGGKIRQYPFSCRYSTSSCLVVCGRTDRGSRGRPAVLLTRL